MRTSNRTRVKTGAGGYALQYSCQWPGCDFDAATMIARGMGMDFLYCCAPHAEEFRSCSDNEARAVSEARQKVRVHRISIAAAWRRSAAA